MAFKAQYVILADSAQQLGRGKVNILGTFDKWWVNEVPTIIRGFMVVALLVASDEDDLGDHPVALKLIRPNGQIAFEQGTNLRVKLAPDTFGMASVRIIIGWQGIPIRETGRHEVAIFVDNEKVAEHPLSVVLGTPPSL